MNKDYEAYNEDGEGLEYDNLVEEYRDHLDVTHRWFSYGSGMELAPSVIIEECDEIAFRVMYSEWLDMQFENGVYFEEPEDAPGYDPEDDDD